MFLNGTLVEAEIRTFKFPSANVKFSTNLDEIDYSVEMGKEKDMSI